MKRYQVISNDRELDKRDPLQGAYVLVVEPTLIDPIWKVQKQLRRPGPSGTIARQLELLLVGYSESELAMMEEALTELLVELSSLTPAGMRW